jgi:hypothetical protein
MSIATNIVARFGAETTVRRHDGSGEYVNGRWQSGGFAEFKVTASVQQMRPDEIIAAPEEARGREMLKVYTDIDLFTVDDSGFKRADLLDFNGVWYEVMQCSRFTMGIQNHVKAIIARLPNQTSGHSAGAALLGPVTLPLIEGFEAWA